ncbi:MAG TPA: APC family permease [Terriglobales bacterium]|nr:APC family permease [Terriglobales bacterium]
MGSTAPPNSPSSDRVRIVVATSVMLTFISYWRAAAVILNDLGSSAFYAGGIAEQAIGKTAPWFIIGVMLFSFAVRAVYVESCSMFVRGGVYRIVKEAIGGGFAKAAVSALMFDYVLTGPISGVSAGQYLGGLLNELLAYADSVGFIPPSIHQAFGGTPQVPVNWVAVTLAAIVTIYYWWQNIKGIEESSEKALRVMQITTVMVVILLSWAGITLLIRKDWQLPPAPIPSNLNFAEHALGFLSGSDIWKLFPLIGIMMAFGHSVLAMSGEESLAQVYREIAHPKLKNLKRTALIIAIYSFIFTGIVSLLAVMLIPDAVRVPVYKDNLIAGLAMYLVGPQFLKILFRVFVVFVGFLILSGAINTAIVGSNGVLNRVSEDGVLTDWFRKPHKRYGTSYRNINMVVIFQLIIIFVSRGDVYLLGEAYAFGVMWSFVFNSTSMLLLRFKYKGERGWKVPPNFKIGNFEVPVGLASVCFVLVSTAIINLFTKSVATVSGLIFAGVFFAIFTISEKVNKRKHADAERQMREHFQLLHRDNVATDSVGVRPNNVLVAVRDYNAMYHLLWALQHTDTDKDDIVVMSARISRFGTGTSDLAMEQIFSDYEQTLFTRAVSVAEKAGKRISLLVVPARDPWSAIVQTANAMQSSAVIIGLSSRMSSQEQAFNLGRAWEAAPEPKRQFVLQVVRPDISVDTFRIGPHAPTMKSEDVHLVHRLWLSITKERGMDRVHHSDVVTLALTRFARDYTGRDRDDILRELKHDGGRAQTPSLPDEGPTLTAEPPSPDEETDKHKRPPSSNRPF